MDAALQEVHLSLAKIKELLTLIPSNIIQRNELNLADPSNVSISILKENFFKSELLINTFFSSDTFREGNHFIGMSGVEYIIKFLRSLESLLSKPTKLKSQIRRIQVHTVIHKLHTLCSLIKFAFLLNPNDYDSLPEDHPRKLAVRSVTTTVSLGNPSQIESEKASFFNQYNMMKAVTIRILEFKNSIGRGLLAGWLLIYYSIFKKEANAIASLFDCEATVEQMKLLWNLTESKLMKQVLPFRFDSVSFNKIIYVPRLSPLVTGEHHKMIELENSLHYTELISQEPLLSGVKYTLISDPGKKRVPIRVLSRFTLDKIQAEEDKQDPKCINCRGSHEKKKLERLIIHVHGGGFIGQSSFSHQNYLRKWANALDVPVFSIDYRLAPENPYPAGLDDVWQAYCWLVKYSNKFLGVTPHKVILVGDSAGGNLITAIALKALRVGFRAPDCMLLIYPALNFNLEYTCRSELKCLDDNVLSHGIVFNVRDCYLPKDQKNTDELVSPIYADEKLMRRFPETDIMVTADDPLSGNAFRFADMLIRSDVRVKLHEYPYTCHGALSFGSARMIPSFMKFYLDSERILKLLVNK